MSQASPLAAVAALRPWRARSQGWMPAVLALALLWCLLPPGALVRGAVETLRAVAGQPGKAHVHLAEGRPGTVTEPVSSEPLVQIPGLNLIVVRVTFPPGALSPRHTHPGSVYVYVLSGSVRSQLLGGPAGTFGPGQTFFEPPGTVHVFAENASTVEPAEILAVFLAPPGVPLISYLTD